MRLRLDQYPFRSRWVFFKGWYGALRLVGGCLHDDVVDEGEDEGAGPQILFQENCIEPSNRAIGARANIIEDLL